MPYTYRNKNTEQEVEYEQRNTRLDHLPNWELVGQPEPADGGGRAAAAIPGPRTPADDETPPEAAAANGEAPARNASKDTWVEYAVSQGASRDEAEAMKRDELVDKYDQEG